MIPASLKPAGPERSRSAPHPSPVPGAWCDTPPPRSVPREGDGGTRPAPQGELPAHRHPPPRWQDPPRRHPRPRFPVSVREGPSGIAAAGRGKLPLQGRGGPAPAVPGPQRSAAPPWRGPPARGCAFPAAGSGAARPSLPAAAPAAAGEGDAAGAAGPGHTPRWGGGRCGARDGPPAPPPQRPATTTSSSPPPPPSPHGGAPRSPTLR